MPSKSGSVPCVKPKNALELSKTPQVEASLLAHQNLGSVTPVTAPEFKLGIGPAHDLSLL